MTAKMEALLGLTPDQADRLRAWYAGGGFAVERKISRLTERLKDAIEAEAFGPLFVDADRNRVDPAAYDPDRHEETQAFRILDAFRAIYKANVLELFDEEGEERP